MENKNEFRYTLYVDTNESAQQYSTDNLLSIAQEYGTFIGLVELNNNSRTDMAIVDNRTAEVIATYHCEVSACGDVHEEYYKSQSYRTAYVEAVKGKAD